MLWELQMKKVWGFLKRLTAVDLFMGIFVVISKFCSDSFTITVNDEILKNINCTKEELNYVSLEQASIILLKIQDL